MAKTTLKGEAKPEKKLKNATKIGKEKPAKKVEAPIEEVKAKRGRKPKNVEVAVIEIPTKQVKAYLEEVKAKRGRKPKNAEAPAIEKPVKEKATKKVKAIEEEVVVKAKEVVEDVMVEKIVEKTEEVVKVVKKLKVHTLDELADVSIEKKLVALYSLQQVDTEINKIRIVRGELPLEVQDLEDEIAGLETRLENFNAEAKELEDEIKAKKAAIKDHQAQIKKYETQQMNVRNNREYDSITKEIEFQTLEIQLCEKKIKEFTGIQDSKTEILERTQANLKERKDDLKQKKLELDEIVEETEKEESKLVGKLQESQKYIEERLITAYDRIKKNARNGLAVVMVERDACGGCFNKIPPQRQLDIKMHKKIIVCEYCGRILVDASIEEMLNEKK